MSGPQRHERKVGWLLERAREFVNGLRLLPAAEAADRYHRPRRSAPGFLGLPRHLHVTQFRIQTRQLIRVAASGEDHLTTHQHTT